MNRSTDGGGVRFLRAAVLAGILGPLTCNGIHDDELHCEEAIAHLQNCCPGLKQASISCRQNTSCGNASARPQIPMEQSDCILARSCEDLTRSTCARALAPTPDQMTGDLLLCP